MTTDTSSTDSTGIEVVTPLSIWMQLASFFFLLSGLHGDLLIIRFSLFTAYSLLLLNAALGSPLWPFVSTGALSIDGLIWAIVGLYVHGSSLLALIWDERQVELSEDQAALWRMMYRTGGISRRIFQTVVAEKLEVIELPTGQTIDTDDYFYIIYNGQIRLKVVEANVSKRSRIMGSGEMFDLKLIGLFSDENTVFHNGSIRCTTLTPVRLFRIAKNDMEKISNHPLAKGVWQALLINNLSYVVESYLSNEQSQRAEDFHDKIFSPLNAWEHPKQWQAGSGQALRNPLLHLWGYIQSSFSPPWPLKGHPTGIRQTQLPPPTQRPALTQEPPRFHTSNIELRGLSFGSDNGDTDPPSTSDEPPSTTHSNADNSGSINEVFA